MDKLKKVFEFLKALYESKYYGTVILKFESGNIVQAKKEESIKF